MITKYLLVLKITLLILAVGWTVLIAFLCLVSFSNLPSFGVSGIDKYVHFTFHFVLTFLWGFYISIKQNKIEINKILVIVAISLFFGILIEFLQETFTKTRHADIKDVLANFSGATIALILFILIKKSKNQVSIR
jgi:VanZ family protein